MRSWFALLSKTDGEPFFDMVYVMIIYVSRFYFVLLLSGYDGSNFH